MASSPTRGSYLAELPQCAGGRVVDDMTHGDMSALMPNDKTHSRFGHDFHQQAGDDDIGFLIAAEGHGIYTWDLTCDDHIWTMDVQFGGAVIHNEVQLRKVLGSNQDAGGQYLPHGHVGVEIHQSAENTVNGRFLRDRSRWDGRRSSQGMRPAGFRSRRRAAGGFGGPGPPGSANAALLPR